MRKIVLLIFAIFVLFSCENKNEGKIKEFTDIYYNILLIREKYPDTALANPQVKQLLNKYGYNQKSFQDASFEIFENDKMLFTKMIDSVRKKAEQEINLNSK
ncbi:MAG TPA: hypothetical protein PLE30_01995 [Candidatus Kapabacteria bacterium]|nr:hypothetical protein [Candidatus Kapabacteria bacterium]